MLFHSPVFISFLIMTVLIYYMFPKYRMYVLALANTIFYAVTGLGYLALFFGVVVSTYGLARLFDTKYRKPAYVVALIIVIGNLVFFKYSLFALHNLETLLSIDFGLKDTVFAKVILPIGISFYTFQLIAYIVDVYRKKLAPTRSMLEFWVFISFFGHSMAGPILRGNDFLPQLDAIQKIRFQADRFKVGIAYIMMGLFKKIVLADQIAPLVNTYFHHAGTLTGSESWIAAYLFAFQIYFDFSAYSEMAVGIGHLLGLRLDLNFKTPYLSRNATEFWRRWHITLSNWIRDYIYFAVGGSRVGRFRLYFNLVFAMTVSGLWHGAAWTFILWGMYYGFLQVAHKMYRNVIDRLGLTKLTESKLYMVVCIVVFFHLTVLGWVLFRAYSLSDAVHMLKQMLTTSPLHVALSYKKYALLIAGLFALHVAEYWMRKHSHTLSGWWHRFMPSPVRAAVYVILIMVVLAYSEMKHSTFIYFQF